MQASLALLFCSLSLLLGECVFRLLSIATVMRVHGSFVQFFFRLSLNKRWTAIQSYAHYGVEVVIYVRYFRNQIWPPFLLHSIFV